MTNNIEKQTAGMGGCVIISSTDNLGNGAGVIPPGQYFALQFGASSTVTSFTPVSTTLSQGTFTKTYPANFVLQTPFTTATISSGFVVAYKTVF